MDSLDDERKEEESEEESTSDQAEQDDLIDVVNDRDEVIDAQPKKIVREKALPHRGVFILLLNKSQQIYVHQRAFQKVELPGIWDIFFGGYVNHQESYWQAAYRELWEEAGIQAQSLNCLGGFHFQGEKDDWFGRLFLCVSNSPITLQKEEVEKGMFIPLKDLPQFIAEKQVKDSSLFAYQQFKGLMEKVTSNMEP